MPPLLSVKNLRKIYPGKDAKPAVDDVSFEMFPGEILGFLGPNGSGKTTTIQMLLGTLKPSSGEIVYFGKDFETHKSEILQNLTFASTYASLPWVLTVKENLEVFGRLYGFSPKKSRPLFLPLVERFGMMKELHSRVSALSAGQVTRLMLIKAFFLNPKVVLLDEPTASLDPEISSEICAFLLEQREKNGVSILFTSHKMEEVTFLCDRVIFLKNGKVIANDLPKNLTKKVSSYKLKLLVTEGMNHILSLATSHHIAHEVDQHFICLSIGEEKIPEFLKQIAHADVAYSTIQIEEPSLEDFFLHIARSNL